MPATTQADPAVAAMLVGMERYNPSNVNPLEAYVDTQCADGSYNLDANLALLKLYQFNPTQTNIDTIAKILVKALMQLPANDFTLYLSLLNDQVLEFEPLPQIVVLQELLETARFPKFWASVADIESVTSGVKGFSDSVRQAIAVTIAITFRTVPRAVLAEALHLDAATPQDAHRAGAELSAFVKGLGWEEGTGALVTVPLNEENQPKPEAAVDAVKFEQLTKLIGASN